MIAAFLIFNLLIEVVINSREEAQEAEFQREQDERRAAAGKTAGDEDDSRVALLQHVHDLRQSLEQVERQARSIVRKEEGRVSGKK